MWNNTKTTQLLGLQYPIIQGPFGGRFSSARLVAAVSNGGGMGSFGLNAYAPQEILEINKEIKALTDKPYALNLWVPLENDPIDTFTPEDLEGLKETFTPLFEAWQVPLPEAPPRVEKKFELQVEGLLASRPPVASFIYGVPSGEIIRELKQRGSLTIATATTLDEALLIEEAGIDLVVASGAEAGGHRASFLKPAEESLTNTFSLLSQVVRKVKIPVITAGGIADGKALYAALQAGASAVQIGTAFLATAESNASEMHKAKLLNRSFETTLTKVYSGRLARLIANSFTKEFANRENINFAPYPIQSQFLSPLWKKIPEHLKEEYLAFWSGQPSSILHHSSAGELLKALVQGVNALETTVKE
jgi:nitronate monooxygenase